MTHVGDATLMQRCVASHMPSIALETLRRCHAYSLTRCSDKNWRENSARVSLMHMKVSAFAPFMSYTCSLVQERP